MTGFIYPTPKRFNETLKCKRIQIKSGLYFQTMSITTGGGFESPLSLSGFCLWQLAVKPLFLHVWERLLQHACVQQEGKLSEMFYAVWCVTRLHTVASMSHESAPDCEQNCLQETFRLSPSSTFFPYSCLPPFFIPLLPFLLFILLWHPFFSSLFSFLGNSWFSTMMQFNSQTICVVSLILHICLFFISPLNHIF